MATQYLTVSWDEFHRDAKALAERLASAGPWRGIVAISRGGLVPATIIARALNIRVVETVSVVAYDQFSQGEEALGEPKVTKLPDFAGDGEGFLIVDDLVDTGTTARVVRAFADCSPGDGEAFLLEVQPGHGTPHMVAVFVDARLGGIAKRLGLIRVINPLEPDSQGPRTGGRGPHFRLVDHTLACDRVRAAIALTDAARRPEVEEDFVGHRALAIARVDHAGLLGTGWS